MNFILVFQLILAYIFCRKGHATKIAFIIASVFLTPRAARAHGGHADLFGLDLNDILANIRAGGGGAFWTAMLIAFAYGALHAMGPGHGKLVVASYFASRRAKYLSGAFMGLQVALFHALSAIALVVLVQEFAKFAFGMDDGLRYIKIIGYGAVTAVGALMLANAARGCACGCCGHKESGAAGWLLALGIGIVPCPGTLALLFYAMSNQMLWTGIWAVMFSALGMAITLCAIGMIGIFTNRKIDHDDRRGRDARAHKFAIRLRAAASFIIMIFGLILLLDSIWNH